MEQLTKKQALESCVAMWDWLSTRPHNDKNDYLTCEKHLPREDPDGWNEPNPNRPSHDCYACEYAIQRRADEIGAPVDDWMSPRTCKHCPVWDQDNSGSETMCTWHGSPYSEWSEPLEYIGTDEGPEYELHMKNAAAEVAFLARVKLEELSTES